MKEILIRAYAGQLRIFLLFVMVERSIGERERRHLYLNRFPFQLENEIIGANDEDQSKRGPNDARRVTLMAKL